MTLGGDRAAGIVYAAVYGFAFLGAVLDTASSFQMTYQLYQTTFADKAFPEINPKPNQKSLGG